MNTQRTITSQDRPCSSLRDNLCCADGDHRFDCDQHSRFESCPGFAPLAGICRHNIGDKWGSVQSFAITMASQSAHKKKTTFLFDAGLHGASPINQWSTRLHRSDPTPQTFSSTSQERMRKIITGFDQICPRRIADPTMMANADVDRYQVAFCDSLRCHVMRSMHNAFIDRNAGVTWEWRMPSHLVSQEA